MSDPAPLAALREVVVRIEQAGRLVPLPAEIGRRMADILVKDVRGRFVTSTDPGGRPWKPLAKSPRVGGGGLPLLDSGLLRASVFGYGTATGAAVATNMPYAALHEYGGTVRPVTSKYLAIPLTREAKRVGSPRRFPVKLKFRPIRGRVARGALYAAKVDHYLLVTEAVVPARPFLAPSPAALAAIDDLIADHLTDLMPR